MGVDQVRKRIRSIREEKGLRALDVAEKIGVSRPFFTQMESGARGLTVYYLFKIAKALDVTIGKLCGESIEDEKLAQMQGYLIPINDKRVWEILNPLLSEEPEDLCDWVIIFSEALKKLETRKRIPNREHPW